MCEPTTMMIGMMVMQGASMAIQSYQSGKARDAAEDAADKQEELARRSEENQLEALEAQMEQETDKASLAKLDRQRQALRERAKIRVSAAESGAFGNTTLRELSAAHVGEGMDKGVIDYNLRNTQESIRRQGEAVAINTETSIFNARSAVPLSTPAWMTGMNIALATGQGAVEGYNLGSNLQSTKATSNQHRSDGRH